MDSRERSCEYFLRISVLTDNQPGTSTQAEHGLSYLVEADGRKVLFDTGQSDLFMRNAEKMGLKPSDADLIVLSHGHFDHGNGLHFLGGGNLLCHPGCFVKRYRKKDKLYIGLMSGKEETSEKFSLTCSSEPVRISPALWFLGEIPRLKDFEARPGDFILDDGSDDPVIDDSALAIELPDGLFVITGCGHAGVVNTLEHARRISGVNRLMGIMGGFHLKENNRQLKETISYLRKEGLSHVLPSHCNQLPALCAFNEAFGSRPVATGAIFIF